MRTSAARKARQWTWLQAHARHELAWETFAETMRVLPTARAASMTHASTDMSSAVPRGLIWNVWASASGSQHRLDLKSIAFILLDTGDTSEAERCERRQVGRCLSGNGA